MHILVHDLLFHSLPPENSPIINHMRYHWSILIALIIGIFIGRVIGPCDRTSSPPPPTEIPHEASIDEALDFIETLEKVELPPNGEWVMCVRVVDGDTIEVQFDDSAQTRDKIRYIGVDTPETVHPFKDVEPYGPEASAINKALVDGKRLYLVKDITDRDRYDRLLRYIYTEDGLFVNFALVACGLAVVVTYPPDVAHVDEYTAAQEAAREAGRGMWGEELQEDQVDEQE